MPLSWNEIKTRALAFSKKWENESAEDAEAKSFWDDFFNIYGISRKRVATFEEPVKKLGEKQGFIDLFWKGVLLVEHKSKGKNLDKAYTQALDYFQGIQERDLPRYVLVSDFANFRLYDLEEKTDHNFSLKELHKNVRLFGFIAGYQSHAFKEQDPVNIKAAERMGKLHDQMKAVGYEGHALELHLVRLLFCLFAEDTSIFERQQFQEYLELRTAEDGSNLGSQLATLFYVLNTPEEKRLKNLDEHLAAFPYVNGNLFQERLDPAGYDSAMRTALLDCCALDWSRISPAIFGSLFQSIMDKQARRNLGAHYTSEKNILKLINPLFMDELRAEFEKVKSNKNKLFEFHKKLRNLKFLDPACGCGNFLVIAYRELRLLELDVLRASHASGQQIFDIHSLLQLDVDQFYGIEIEEFPAQIAQVAMWLMDHQMNLLVSEEFGMYFARIPLKSTANIVHGNALRIDWNDVVSSNQLNYIMGNPPFVGYQWQDAEQKEDVISVFSGLKAASSLDFVACWYLKAAKYIQDTIISCAYVSTNSVVQGEQVAILWPELVQKYGIKINFAHRTFQWNNEARGKAAVHCVIVGFSLYDSTTKWIFEYENIKADPLAIKVSTINPYLVDAPMVTLDARRMPIANIPKMTLGSMPKDGGNLLLDKSEMEELIKLEPKAKNWIRQFSMGNEYINAIPRYCLWLVDCSPNELKDMPEVLKRVERVRDMRLASPAPSTRSASSTPTVFKQLNQPDSNYLAFPRVSSERRRYIPIGYLPKEHIAGDKLYTVPNATLFHFGILTSDMHMSWMRVVAGRLKSDYSYSNTIVYNNFPWPENHNEKQRADIEKYAQDVLDARKQFPDASLADLYDPLTMPPVLLKAHQKLDKAVDAAYGKSNFNTEAERVAFLFELYQKYTSLLPVEKKSKSVKKKK